MTVEVLIFGPAAMAAQSDHVRVTVGEVAVVGDVLLAMAVQHPGLAPMLVGARLAVNQAFVRPETRVSAGDELALIALVGGG